MVPKSWFEGFLTVSYLLFVSTGKEMFFLFDCRLWYRQREMGLIGRTKRTIWMGSPSLHPPGKETRTKGQNGFKQGQDEVKLSSAIDRY